VSDSRDQAAEGRELFGFDETVLRVAKLRITELPPPPSENGESPTAGK